MDIDTYVKENPEIWSRFKQFTLEAASKGRTRLSSRLVIERIRWDTILSENWDFKINNNVAPGLARKFMREYPGMEGFFRTRG